MNGKGLPWRSGRRAWAGPGFYKKPAQPMGLRPKRVIAEGEF
jgi:hypothetical protein